MTTSAGTDRQPADIFARRRKHILGGMPRESALFLPGVTAEQTGDAPVRQNSDFYYLSGFNQTDAALLLVKPKKGKSVEILFCRQPNRTDILWRGRYLAPTEAAHLHRFSIGYPISELRQHLRQISAGLLLLSDWTGSQSRRMGHRHCKESGRRPQMSD